MTTATAEARQAAQTHERTLAGLVGHLQQLTTALGQSAIAHVVISDNSAPVQAPASGIHLRHLILWASADPEPLVGVPERYNGACETCRPFLTNCSLLFALQSCTFATEKVKVAFVMNCLTGRGQL